VTFGRLRDKDRSRTLVRRDALGLLALVLLLLWLAPALARAQGADSLVLHWTAPGDDGNTGTAAIYELRMAVIPLTATNYTSGLQVPGMPAPAPAGTPQSYTLYNMTRGTTYWFVLRTMDEKGNWSGPSNIVQFNWPTDTSPPATPTGVSAGLIPSTPYVRVSWTPNAEPDLAGYRVYRATAPEGPWTRLVSTSVTASSYVDAQLPAGADVIYYAVSAFDRSGGEGPRSGTVSAALKAGLPGAPLAWDLQAPYPNPAKIGETMRLPIAVPQSGAAAHLDIIDGSGRQLRRFDLSGASPGIFEVTWDGLNGAGRACAPGVYRAILSAPGATRSLPIARVP
jgi:hypothetical protein